MAPKPKINAVSYRFQRFHPALQTGHGVTVKSKREDPVHVHFAQGELVDGACGLHFLSSVLVILQLAKPSALQDMRRRKFGVAAKVWAAFSDTYFTGVHAPDLVERVESLQLPLIVTARHGYAEDADGFALECLMRGELVALAFTSVKNQRTKHWALGVGVEGLVDGRETKPDTLLMLDPGASDPFFSAYNTRLSLPQSGPGSRSGKSTSSTAKKKTPKPIHWIYESPEWASEPVALLAAVRFQLAEWP